MAISINLLEPTDSTWIQKTTGTIDSFLTEAADCERKASSTALFFISKYPKYGKVLEEITNIAIGNLQNFKKLQALIRDRELELLKEINKNLYLSKLTSYCRGGREERFLDRLIVATIAELRAAERYNKVSGTLTTPDLNTTLESLGENKLAHANKYLRICGHYFEKNDIDERVEFFLEIEYEILSQHSNHPSLY